MFPYVYEATAYPVQVALEGNWELAKAQLRRGEPVAPYIVEMIAILERTLNFIFTGSARVIDYGPMYDLFAGRAMLETGYPCFPADLFNFSTHDFYILPSKWPTNDDGTPKVSSRASQIFNCREHHWQVSYHNRLAPWHSARAQYALTGTGADSAS